MEYNTYLSIKQLNKLRKYYLNGIDFKPLPIIKPERIIYNEPATIIIWNDGTKTVAKCDENDTYNPESGFAICVAKKYLGESEYHKSLNKSVTIRQKDWDAYCKEYAYEISNARNAIEDRLINLSRVNHLDIEDKLMIKGLYPLNDFSKLIRDKKEKKEAKKDLNTDE